MRQIQELLNIVQIDNPNNHDESHRGRAGDNATMQPVMVLAAMHFCVACRAQSDQVFFSPDMNRVVTCGSQTLRDQR